MKTITILKFATLIFFFINTPNLNASLAFNTFKIINSFNSTNSNTTSLIISPTNIENEFNLVLNNDEQIKTYKLLNDDMQLLYEVSIDELIHQLTLNLSGIPNGDYFITVSTNTGQEITKDFKKY